MNRIEEFSAIALRKKAKTVSYTHLDVYKRQRLRRARQDHGPYFANPRTPAVHHTTVSYTHLDVYKRQVVSNLTRKPPLPAVAVTPVTRGNIEQTLDTSGLVSSLSEKTYFSPVSANIAKLPVAVGDNVSAGDLIVGYDLDSIQEQVQKANLELTAARSGYHDLSLIHI